MQRCTRCILPKHYPGIEFDEAGVCNYCRAYKKKRYKGKEELDKFLEPLRNKGGEYDCVVGISGGRDSSYALYYLTKVCNLRVLAYSADNGFIPEVAKLNMKNIADTLGVELVVEEHDFLKRCVKRNVSSWLRNPSPQMIPMICCGCRLGIVHGLLECAKKNNAPLVAVGGGTPVEICYFKRAFFNTNLFGRKSEPLLILLGLLYEMVKNPSYLAPINMSIYAAEYLYYFPAGIRTFVYPNQKVLRLYHYIEWDEDVILSTIKSELNWQKSIDSASSWRFDCRMSFLKNYLLRESFGFTEKEDYLSHMIREGMITREEALDRLQSETVIPQKLITELCDEIGLDPSHISAVVETTRKKVLGNE